MTARDDALALAMYLQGMREKAQAEQKAANSPVKAVTDIAKGQVVKHLAGKAGDALGLTGGSTAATAATTGTEVALPGAVATGVDGLPIMANPAFTGAASASPGAFSLGGIGTAGNAILPVAGALGLGELLLNKRHGGRGAAQGAASGAAIGTGIAPGIGTLIGALAGGGLGYFGNFGDVDRWNTEQGRSQDLVKKGVTGWDKLASTMPQLSKGRSKDELTRKDLAPDFIGKDSQGNWVNNKFAQSRNEKDLRPEDIWGYSAFGETFGNDWLGKYSEDQRRQIAQKALDLGAVKEKYGSIDLGNLDELKTFAGSLPSAPPPGAPSTRGRQQQPASSGKKRSSGKLPPLEELPPLTSPQPQIPAYDPRLADAYKRIYEQNQGVTGNNPLLKNPWLAMRSQVY